MRKLIVAVVLLVICSSVRAQTSRYWADIDLASIEGALVFPADGSLTLDLLDFKLPRVTSSASIVVSEGTAAISWRPVEVEPFGLSNFDIDIAFVSSNADDEVQTVALPIIAGNSWGPSNVVLPFPAIEATGAYRNEPFVVEFQPTDFAIGIEEVRLGADSVTASLTQLSQFDSGTPVQELLPPNMHDTSLPDTDLIINHWFTVKDFAEVFFDYSDIVFHETPMGDANNDGRVDQNDFFVLSFNFGLVDEPTWEDGDFNDDGIVDFEDFLGLAFNFDGALQAAAVPEPNGSYLIIGAVACLGFRRRRTNC